MKKFKVFKILICLITLTIFVISCKKEVVDSEKTVTTETTVKDEYGEVENSENGDGEVIHIQEAHEVLSPMELKDIAGYRDTDKSTYIEIVFSKNIQDKFDGTPYIKVEPETEYTVSKVDNRFILKGNFNASITYKVTVLKGIRAVDGAVSSDEDTVDIVFDQKKPKIVFTNDGIILPSIYDKRVYLRTLNVTKVNIVVKKIYANNTTQFLQGFDFRGNGQYWSYGFDYVGDVIYDINFDIENEIDTWVQSAIDLTGVIDTNGFYMIEAKYDRDGTSYKFPSDMSDWRVYDYLYENGKVTKTILLTNIGIMASKNKNGYLVNVLDIVENRPIRGAKVYLMSRNNQILEEKTSDSNGVVNFESNDKSFYVYVDDNKSKSVLVLNKYLSTNGFSVDGAYATEGVNGYIYTERGVYRPGDPIYISLIARNNDKPLEDNQPVKITVYDPTGSKMIENDVIKDGKNGFYTYAFKTETSARTGIWKLEATIGNQVFKKDISVETVVPNRIKVDLNFPDTVNVNSKLNDFIINANYLFGEPAGNLKYNVSFDIREEPVSFEKYKDYTFKAPTSYGYYDNKYYSGVLNDKGYAVVEPNFDEINFGSVNMLVDVSGRVIEDGGRTVSTSKYLKLKKYDTYIGIENSNQYKRPGSKLDLSVICVTEDGEKLVPNKKLKYRIYGNDYYWWWDYSDYDNFIRSFKSDKNTKLMEEGELFTKDTPYLMNNTLPSAEYIYVEIEDETTGQVVGVNLQSSEWVDPSVTKKVETLNIISDKKKYSVGDFAQIKYKGVESAQAIITIEKAGKIIDQQFRSVDKVDMVEQIKITKDMAPNIYVYITLIQNYMTKENDRPLRLYGVIPLVVEDSDTKIDLEIEAPENIRPNEKFTVNIRNKKREQVDYTIAVVDEGLLDITAFKTPAPWDYFFKKLASNILLYDNYSEIIDRPYGAINQILKVGGDEALLDEMARRRRLKELGLEDADRFKPVSMFKGVLTTDNNGNASVEFEMPNYMGSVRIMVVAAKGNSYGSVERNMIVKAPLIVQPTIPRTLKVDDHMNIPVSVFALEEGIGNVEVYYQFKGKTQTKNLTMVKGDKQIVYFDDSIGKEVGNEKLTIGVKSKVYNYEETVGMAINSNNPPIEISENEVINGKNTVTFKQSDDYVKGTVDSVLTISNIRLLGLDQRLKYLIRYPYGCAEQTTSSVFPQLFIDKLSTIKNYNKSEVIDNINSGISRLKLFQLSNGSFSYWPGDNYTSDFATNYIGHFLISAKKNGYYVPDSMFVNWLSYMQRTVKGKGIESSYGIDWKSYALYLLALADKANVSEMNYMYENHFNNMNLTSKMYLAAAYKLAGEENTALTIASKINTTSVKNMFDELFARDRYYYSYSYGSKLREIAVYLDCYYTIYGKIDTEAFDEILNSLRSKDWYSTQTTAYSLLALSNIVTDNLKEEIKGVIDIDGVKTEYTTTGQYRLEISEGAKNITVTSTTDGTTYVNYFWEGVPIHSNVEEYAEGFTIDRKYYNESGESIDVSNLNSGDSFWMKVVVEPMRSNSEYVDNIAVTQVLPSCWEIENLRVTNSKSPKWVEDESKNTNVSYTDIRDDRVMWFFNHTRRSDVYNFFVKINVVTKGEYDFPGTTLEAMYDNNFRAYKKGSRVKVK